MSWNTSLGSNKNSMYFRLWILLAAVLYPLWSLYLHYFHEDHFNNYTGKIVIGAISMSIYLLSFKNQFVKKRLSLIANIMSVTVATHYMWLSYNDSFSMLYLLGMTVLVLGFSILFTSVKRYAVFAGLFLCALYGSLYFGSSEIQNSLAFAVLITGVSFLTGVSVFVRSKILREYRALSIMANYKKQLESDFYELKQKTQVMENQIHRDSLTGLMNRDFYKNFISNIESINNKAELEFSLFVISLNDLKAIDDTFGHGVSDVVLQTAAERIADIFREKDLVCRFSEGCFVAVITNTTQRKHLNMISERVLTSLAQSMSCENKILKMNSSIGVASYPSSTTDIHKVFKLADNSRLTAQKIGKNNFYLWDDAADAYSYDEFEEVKKYGT